MQINNIEFTNEDLFVCLKQLKMLLDDYQEIPWKVYYCKNFSIKKKYSMKYLKI